MRTLLESKDHALQKEAVLLLGATAEGAGVVGKLFLQGKLPRDLLPQVSDLLTRHAGKDPQLAKLYAAVVKSGLRVGNSPEEVSRLRKLVAEKGNPMRGRALYLNSKTLACVNCHRLEGVGGSVGPDLTRLWDTQSLEKIVESIVEPSKEIKEGFQSYVATTKKGQVFTGLKILENGTEVILRDAEGRDVRLAKTDVEELTVSKTSLMPDNVISQLTYGQLIDLVAFLRDRRAQESLRGLVLEYHVIGPFGGDLKKEELPVGKADLKAAYPGKSGEVKWRPVQAEPSGLLNLRDELPRRSAVGLRPDSCFCAESSAGRDAVRVERSGAGLAQWQACPRSRIVSDREGRYRSAQSAVGGRVERASGQGGRWGQGTRIVSASYRRRFTRVTGRGRDRPAWPKPVTSCQHANRGCRLAIACRRPRGWASGATDDW